MESYGANCIYCTDSAGYMLPDDVTARIGALRAGLRPETEVGFHGHHNLSMGVANSLAAIEAGARRIDASAAGLGAGAGNTPLEVFVAVLDRMGAVHGVDLYKVMDRRRGPRRADDGSPRAHRPRRARAGLRRASTRRSSSSRKRAGEKYGVSSRDILVEMGRRKTVGGQEDMIEDVALDLARAPSEPS